MSVDDPASDGDLAHPVTADAHARERLDDEAVGIADESGGVLATFDGDGFAVAIFVSGEATEASLHQATAATYRQLARHCEVTGRFRGEER